MSGQCEYGIPGPTATSYIRLAVNAVRHEADPLENITNLESQWHKVQSKNSRSRKPEVSTVERGHKMDR